MNSEKNLFGMLFFPTTRQYPYLIDNVFFSLVYMHIYLPCHKTICAVNNWDKRLFRANHDIINNGGPNYIALLQHKVLHLLFFLVRKKIRWKLLVSISGVPNNSYSAIGGSQNIPYSACNIRQSHTNFLKFYCFHLAVKKVILI